MSRNLNRSGCGFFMGLMAGAFLMTSTLAAQETTAKHPAPAPAIPGVQALNDHPFSSLLDDVTIEPQPYANGYFSFVAQCQLNAPLDSAAVTNANSAQSETEATWAQLMTYTCNDKNCNNSNLTFTNSPSSNLSPNCNSPKIFANKSHSYWPQPLMEPRQALKRKAKRSKQQCKWLPKKHGPTLSLSSARSKRPTRTKLTNSRNNC